MILYYFLAFVAGLAAVTQSGITKQLARETGLASILHLSNFVVFLGGILIFSAVMLWSEGDFAKLLKGRPDFKTIGFWFLLPGLCGLFLVTVTPLTVAKVGALQVFCLVIFGQVLGSSVWDWKFEDLTFDRYRVIGIALTLLGAISVSMSPESGGK